MQLLDHQEEVYDDYRFDEDMDDYPIKTIWQRIRSYVFSLISCVIMIVISIFCYVAASLFFVVLTWWIFSNISFLPLAILVAMIPAVIALSLIMYPICMLVHIIEIIIKFLIIK